MKETNVHPTIQHESGACDFLPEFRRPNYFFGQMLGLREFRGALDYQREKLRLLYRCAIGHGVVCGLHVRPLPVEEDCDPPPAQQSNHEYRPQRAPARIEVDCGFAVDCHGNEIVVRRPVVVDVMSRLPAAVRKQLECDECVDVYVSVCYCEQMIEPTRPALPNCESGSDCQFGWTREGYKILVSATPPPPDDRCDSCCEPCCPDSDGPCHENGHDSCGCVPLAVIRGFSAHGRLHHHQIDESIRRSLSRYETTRVAGVSWSHGGAYTPSEIRKLFGADRKGEGLEIRLSRGVRTSTIRPGVLDLWVLTGGPGVSGSITHMAGEFVNLPGTEFTDRIRYRHNAKEWINGGDMVLITLRGDFILDACCRALDGNHIGGRVPILEEYREQFHRDTAPGHCHHPPGLRGPWRSGNGTEGGDFVSWVYVRADDKETIE